MSTAEDRSTAVGPLDAVHRDPDHHDVLLENEHVRVLDALLRPGEQTEIHTHVWPSALYVLSWSDFVRIDPEGKVIADSRTMNPRPRPGEAIWSPALPPHYVRNVGNADLRLIAVELKSVR
jgi:mannose-6-phosphate isomerase-like protein (cupin superfamily)